MGQIDFETEANPLLVGAHIEYRVADGLRDKSLSLYEAYLLNQEAVRIQRYGYRQRAWNHTLSISGLLRIYMQYLSALAFGEEKVSAGLIDWLRDDIPLLREIRAHYITSNMGELLVQPPTALWLKRLSQIRADYDNLSDDDGPYHCEQFPFDYASPEDALLGMPAKSAFVKSAITADTERLLIAVSVREWG